MQSNSHTALTPKREKGTNECVVSTTHVRPLLNVYDGKCWNMNFYRTIWHAKNSPLSLQISLTTNHLFLLFSWHTLRTPTPCSRKNSNVFKGIDGNWRAKCQIECCICFLSRRIRSSTIESYVVSGKRWIAANSDWSWTVVWYSKSSSTSEYDNLKAGGSSEYQITLNFNATLLPNFK